MSSSIKRETTVRPHLHPNLPAHVHRHYDLKCIAIHFVAEHTNNCHRASRKPPSFPLVSPFCSAPHMHHIQSLLTSPSLLFLLFPFIHSFSFRKLTAHLLSSLPSNVTHSAFCFYALQAPNGDPSPSLDSINSIGMHASSS